jgi:hypothetical protein
MRIKPTIVKVLASTVPYGDAICTRGEHVWCAYDGDRLVCVGATSKQARERYQRARLEGQGVYGKAPAPLPSGLDGRRDKPSKL